MNDRIKNYKLAPVKILCLKYSWNKVTNANNINIKRASTTTNEVGGDDNKNKTKNGMTKRPHNYIQSAK